MIHIIDRTFQGRRGSHLIPWLYYVFVIAFDLAVIMNAAGEEPFTAFKIEQAIWNTVIPGFLVAETANVSIYCGLKARSVPTRLVLAGIACVALYLLILCPRVYLQDVQGLR